MGRPTMCARTLAVVLGALSMAATFGVPAVAADEEHITLMTHSSFALPDEVLERFEAEHGVELDLLDAGDAGSMVNQAILTRDRPLADVMFGIDNTFLSRALDADIFVPYASPALEDIPSELQLDPEHRVTPIDYGDVCLNVDRAAILDGELPEPASLEDLTDPELAGALVVENPATSSPGLAFLLATVAYFGEDPETGWQAYWRSLRENDVAIAAGWEEAYYGGFSGGSGEGDRPIVVSYATSPVAEVVYGPDPDALVAPTSAVDDGCFRQIEFAGILRGTDQLELAGALIEHLLAPETQAEFPLNMLVYPARSAVELPQAFVRHALIPTSPLSLEPAAIDEGRERWIREWTDIVLR